MSNPGRKLRLLLLIAAAPLLVIGPRLALADSDYERGYRDGYGKGFQDGQASHQSGAAKNFANTAPGIVVIRAWYGDDHKSCDLTAWAAGRFNNRTSADVEVTNTICGDPAPGKRKSLRVEYLCKGEMKTADAYEHRRISLSCY